MMLLYDIFKRKTPYCFYLFEKSLHSHFCNFFNEVLRRFFSYSCQNSFILHDIVSKIKAEVEVHQPMEQIGIWSWVGEVLFCLTDHIQG